TGEWRASSTSTRTPPTRSDRERSSWSRARPGPSPRWCSRRTPHDPAGPARTSGGRSLMPNDPVAGPPSGPAPAEKAGIRVIVARLGERTAAALGVAIVGVSAVLTGLAPTFALAVVFRASGGGGSAMLFTALTSYLLKVVPKERMGRTLGLFYGSFNVGVIAG